MRKWEMDVGTVSYEREDDDRAVQAAAEFFYQIECDSRGSCADCKLANMPCSTLVNVHPEEVLQALGVKEVGA